MCRLLVALLTICSSVCFAWELQPGSSLTVAVGGEGRAEEVYRFGELRGVLDNAGVALLTVPLSGIDTGQAERDQNIRSMLFDVGKFPNATFLAMVDMGLVSGLPTGQPAPLPVTGRLTLRGRTVEITADTSVVRASDGTLHVTSVRPVLIDTVQFDMAKGLARLMRAGGVDIDSPVPVSFALIFAP